MQPRIVVVTVALLAGLAIPSASAGSGEDRATGGGQMMVGARGAGDTIAFSATANPAPGSPTAAKGQVQYIDRDGGTGQDNVRFHGVVDCLLVLGNTAEMAGHARHSGAVFTLRVIDNGEGAASEADMIFFDDSAEDASCSEDDNDEQDVGAQARGNVQVYDAP